MNVPGRVKTEVSAASNSNNNSRSSSRASTPRSSKKNDDGYDKLEESAFDMFPVLKTLFNMLKHRGYNVEDYDNFTMESFRDKFLKGHGLSVGDIDKRVFESHRDPTEQIKIFICDMDKVGVKPVREILENLQAYKIKRGILLVRGTLSAFGKQAIIVGKPTLLEAFTYAELRFDVMEHKFVPKHELLTPEEKKQLLQKYNLDGEVQLPRLKTTDPVSKYLGLSKGDVVRITRDSDTAGKYATYRVVWNN